ncbi:unnamed protein product (macronuclear) [Paramecium tetraurelia]|uniref:Transmembrane protein n=1 Tax=Paramecium tetraurelia TaxID=5888 RepID=A0BB53_PARTE|nr:uncharacterized protein GSPATT00000205001 [Paramecium tetraurelia]CAK55770.1 unnamed protein product [Paramecium tetraurelia]|eukprot:XP_001423168.1 hypothetical protein (macronuclear) [Paramecium tetraurelia strain d4-2]
MHNHINSSFIFVFIKVLLSSSYIHSNWQLVQQICQQYLIAFLQFIVFQRILKVYQQLDLFQLWLSVMKTLKDDQNLKFNCQIKLQFLGQKFFSVQEFFQQQQHRGVELTVTSQQFLVVISYLEQVEQNSAIFLIASHPKNNSLRYTIINNIAQDHQVDFKYIFIYIANTKVI